MHKVFVRDVVAIDREVMLPDHCPRCEADFGPGSMNVKLWSLKPVFDQLRLTTVIACGKEEHVFETRHTPQKSVQDGDWDRLPAIFKCANCGLTLAKYHRRTWILEALDERLAAQLRTLLYDSNVKDPTILKKVWGMMGYQGNCMACNVETELGTEEVPHPVDPRVHTCARKTDELNTER